MAIFDIVMPKMGESIQEATITKWFIKPGDTVEEDDLLLEIATDKVDSEVPSPVDGVVSEVLFNQDDVVAVGEVIARISLDGEGVADGGDAPAKEEKPAAPVEEAKADSGDQKLRTEEGKFLSPVVRSMVQQHNISDSQLASIAGTGLNGRITKTDVEQFVAGGVPKEAKAAPAPQVEASKVEAPKVPAKPAPVIPVSAEDEIIKMDRMRKLISDYMVASKQTSPHVTSVVEADVTNIVKWRAGVKDEFIKKYGQKLTYMPIISEAVAKALRDFPHINVSVRGDEIIVKKNINIGIAVSLPTGNLIVPVVKNADQLNLAGLAGQINGIATKARSNSLAPEDIQGGTFTITNFGSFNNIIGTPIINQPEVAILATGAIEKKPAVIETPEGDFIGIRQKMYLSLSYDHRVVDGMLGGSFLRRIADYLEDFDTTRTV